MASSSSTTSAFHEIAPSASTSGASSTPIHKPRYDVFINHRGPDVKKTLASRIYEILGDMKVTAFLDSEELEDGDFLPTTLEAAIRGATLHIAIFSKRYAESRWCLEELLLMLESGAKIIPIFYYLQPNDLRCVGKGLYADAFETHEKKYRYTPEKLQEWKDALYKVSFNKGNIIQNNDDEMRLLKNIVNIVLKEISNVPLVVAKHPVGLNEAVTDFENTLQLVEGDQGVQIVGIWGMGGSGKTTLAKELYNKRCSSLERSSFIFDIREANGVLHNKQIQLLNGLSVNQTFDNVEQGKAILARHLKSFRALIVMDDVDHVDQLDALLPAKESLGRDSLIIVTTREREVLMSCGIFSVYKMRPLDPFNAKQIFCWHAFLQPSPFDGFEELVKKFVEICHGLPLSLKVFGGLLYGKSCKQYWESLFHKISRILPGDVKEILKVSYNALDDEEKEAFLDTACFFIGERTSLAIDVWEGSGWSDLYTWERLLNKCLVELDYDNSIRMHDHLRDLGREIANRHSPCRLWSLQQITNADKQTEKGNVIRGIKKISFEIERRRSHGVCLPVFANIHQFFIFVFLACCSQEEPAPDISGRILLAATSLAGLKILVITGDDYNQVISEVSRELLCLCWSNIRQRNLPAGLLLKNLRVLELSEYPITREYRLEELWKAESDAPVQLRELVISNCIKFKRFPNSIGCLNELKKIVVIGSYNVSSLPEEFCRLQFLEHLELLSCTVLSSLPNSFGDLTNLRYLDLSQCSQLRRLPVSFKNLMLLQYLNLHGCGELILASDDFQNILKLEYLSLSLCVQLEVLPRYITDQASLRVLSLNGVKRSRELPIKIHHLSRLRNMNIGSDLLIGLPNSIGNLSSLTYLDICNCPNLESLPTSLGDLFSLTHLSIVFCPKLICLPSSVGRLNLLKRLYISACPISQVDFGAASSSFALKSMCLLKTEVCRISISEDRFPNLQSLQLRDNDHLAEIEALPVNLQWLSIGGCPKLEELRSIARLTSLREFEVADCDRLEKIEGLKYCTSLETLKLHGCWDVFGIESLEHLGKLRTVDLGAKKGSAIESCIQTIQKWPDEIIIWTWAVCDASSRVDSLLLSPNLLPVDSFSNKDLFSDPELRLQKHSSNGNAIMLCFVINVVSSSQKQIMLGKYNSDYNKFVASMNIDGGGWALISIFTKHSRFFTADGVFQLKMDPDLREGVKVEVERGLAVRGEEQTLREALFSLLQSI